MAKKSNDDRWRSIMRRKAASTKFVLATAAFFVLNTMWVLGKFGVSLKVMDVHYVAGLGVILGTYGTLDFLQRRTDARERMNGGSA